MYGSKMSEKRPQYKYSKLCELALLLCSQTLDLHPFLHIVASETHTIAYKYLDTGFLSIQVHNTNSSTSIKVVFLHTLIDNNYF